MFESVSSSFRQCSAFLLFFLLCSAGWVRAQTPETDLGLEDYPHARIVFRSQLEDDDYILALGSFKKVEGMWSVDNHQRLSGRLTRKTLELPSTHSVEDGFQFYLRQLKKLSARELYRCDGRECGPSNSWANNHFKVIQLYGLDQHQHYAAYEVIQEQKPPYYISLYTVLRGNKRVLVQLDILRSDKAPVEGIATDPDSLLRLFQTQGFYVFPGAVTDDDAGQSQLLIRPEHVQTLVQVLKRQSQWRLALVGHEYRASALADQQRDSLRYAESLKHALVKAGIAEARLVTHGLGSLAPAGRGNQSARVEVVKLSN